MGPLPPSSGARAASMDSSRASLQRQVRIHRALMVAIFFVASLQFFVPDPNRGAAAVHPFRRGEGGDRSRPTPSSAKGKAGNNTSVSRNDGSKVKPLASVGSSATKKDSGSYNVGEFCPYCTYSDNALCEDRVAFLVSKYRISEEEAKKNDAVKEKCTTPPMPHKIYAADEEPYIIFHGGPHKTGTTALQTFIYDLKYNNGTLFLNDNLRVPDYDELPGGFGKEGVGLNLPHCSIRDYKDGGGQVNIGSCARMRQSFPSFVMDAYNNSQNILIVAEDFDQLGIDFKRMRFFLQPYKRIKFAVTYRRLHEWLPSFYNNIVLHWTKYYAQGEVHFPSVVEWLEKNLDEFIEKHTMREAERFQSYDIVESVDILNVHDIPNLIEHYFCDHLGAKSVCQAIKDGASPSKTNAGTNHEYERLAIEANLRGKGPAKFNMHIEIQRIRAARYLNQKVDEKNVTLPTMCPSKELLDKLLKKEIEQESTYFPEWYASQGGEEGLRRSFDAAVAKKLCSLDVEKIFADGLLDSIFDEWTK